MGVAVSGTALMGFLQSCKTEVAAPDWVPSFFNGKDAALVEEMADIILPPTETPGAKEAGAIRRMDDIIGHFYDQNGKDKFNAGLSVFKRMISSYSQNDAGEEEYDINREELTGLLQEHLGKWNKEELKEKFDQLWGDAPEDPKARDGYHMMAFLKSVKEQAIAGYFCSELIGTEHLAYAPVPGEWVGCLPYEEVGAAWAE